MEKLENAEQAIRLWAARFLGDHRFAAGVEHGFAIQLTDGTQAQGLARWAFEPGPPRRVIEGAAAELVINVSSATLLALANGELNAQVAYLSGAVQLEGNIENALELHGFFDVRVKNDSSA